MPHISAKGMPSGKTRGHLGDIYTDTSTGDQFKCISAYHTTVHGKPVDSYEWKFISDSKSENTVVERKESKKEAPKDIQEPEQPIHEPYVIVEDETVSEFVNAEESETVSEVPRQDSRRDRSNYSKQYRNKKRNQ